MKRIALVACVVASLTACVEQTATARDTCAASPWQSYIGAPVSALQAAGLPVEARILRPGLAVTREFNAARLNVGVGSDGIVQSVYCG
jgi:hypothetical protein